MDNSKIRNNKQILESLARAASSNSGRIHVSSRNGTWVVRKEGSKRALKKGFRTSAQAEHFAIELLQAKKTTRVVIHNKNGTVSRVIPK